MAENWRRALVSGGAGFLGSHLCDLLLAAGLEVVALDSMVTGSPANVAHLAGRPDFALIEQDVCEPVAIEGPVDLIFHLASPASPVDFPTRPIEIMRVNSVGTQRLLDLAHERGARFLMASTSEVYGDPLEHPQAETYLGNVNPIGVRSVYDEAKRFAEAMTMAYYRTYGVEVRIVRIFNTYGERMRLDDGRVVPNFVGQALRGEPITIYGTGQQTRSFTFRSDLLEGIWRLMRSAYVGPVNIGTPVETTMLEFAQATLAAAGSASPIEFRPLPTADDPQRRRPDITLARELLGWEPRVMLAEGLARTIEDFRRRG